jgi:hypothetical protein
MPRFVIVLSGLASGRWNALVGQYLRAFDPDAHAGRGSVESTADLREAMVFEDHAAAMEVWTRQSRVRPLRPDGKPNRPLTAYTISIEPLD